MKDAIFLINRCQKPVLTMVFSIVSAVASIAMVLPPSTTDPATVSGSSSSITQRTFHYVPMGTPIDDTHLSVGRPAIACDGRVNPLSRIDLELSHWNGNTTPDEYYADTSTEMALLLPLDQYPDAVVLNNHVDTDGILSVFACVQPQLARQYAPLLIAAAEAGDFGEWNHGNNNDTAGLQLDACLGHLAREYENDAAAVYQQALDILPDLLHDISTTGGTQRYQAWWEPTVRAAHEDYACFERGEAMAQAGPGSIVLVQEPPLLSSSPQQSRPFSNFAIHRHLVESGLWAASNRLLRYSVVYAAPRTGQDDYQVYRYRYEQPGHGWVHKLRARRPIVQGTQTAELIDKLNTIYDEGEWLPGNGHGDDMVSLCHTKIGLDDSPEEVAALLMDLDSGAR
jgi:hypothetical protein